MKAIRTKNFKEPIILIKILNDDSLLVVDAQTTVRFLEKNSLELLNGFKGKINHLRYKTNVVSFSNDGAYFVSLSADCKESKLYDSKTKKNIAKVNRHHGEVSCVGIDPLARYMFSCGDDGKTFAIDIKSGKLAFTLPIHIDTINDIAFSKNAQWIATASYDRKIQLFNLSIMTPKQQLKAHSSPIIKLEFLSKQRLCSIDKKNSAIIWNINSGKVLHRLQGIHDDVTQVTVGSDNKFLFIGTSLGYVLVYELETYELLDKKYIKLRSTITAIYFDESTHELIIGTDDGDVLFYDIYYGEKFLKELLQQRDLVSIQTHVDTNPLLKYTQVYTLVSNLWEKTFAKAKLYLQNNDTASAISLFKIFKNIPAKNKIMQKTIQEYSEFGKFTLLVKQGKLPLAYGLANLHPLYKETKIYKSLELQWKKSFTAAQKYALDPKGADKAKELLAPYRGISEKTKLIQDLLTQGEVYKRFKIAIGQKDFKIAHELIKQHKFLMEFSEYDSLMNYADTLYIKSQELIKKSDTHTAIKMLRILLDFSDFENEAKELILDIESKQKFFNAIKEKDIILAYNLLSISEDLQETDDGARLQEQWNLDLGKANALAVKGNIDEIEAVMKLYMNISSKYMALGSIFGWAYMVQLENAIRQKKPQAAIENGIKNYILCFGVQNQIENFFKIFKKYYKNSKLNLELQTKGSLSMWRPSMIVNSILD